MQKRNQFTKEYLKNMWPEEALAANLETKRPGQITISNERIKLKILKNNL